MDNKKYELTLEQKMELCWQTYHYTRAVQDFERYKKYWTTSSGIIFDLLTYKAAIDVCNKLNQIERLKKELAMVWRGYMYGLR